MSKQIKKITKDQTRLKLKHNFDQIRDYMESIQKVFAEVPVTVQKINWVSDTSIKNKFKEDNPNYKDYLDFPSEDLKQFQKEVTGFSDKMTQYYDKIANEIDTTVDTLRYIESLKKKNNEEDFLSNASDYIQGEVPQKKKQPKSEDKESSEEQYYSEEIKVVKENNKHQNYVKSDITDWEYSDKTIKALLK